MKRNKRSLRIVKRKAEHGNPKDFTKVELLPTSPLGPLVIIDDKIIIKGKVYDYRV